MASGERPMVMGVLNITPDSFSDGGRYLEVDRAVQRGREMFDQGADIVDVGGESSRPGSSGVSEAEELRRVLPVIGPLAGCGRVSVDTVKPEVARRAVEAGASLLNDISGTLWPVAAELGVGWVAMHMRGRPRTMQQHVRYMDVVREVRDHLMALAEHALAHGVKEVWVDPGIGFAKTAEHNLELLACLSQLVDAAAARGCRVLVGTSRKSFLGLVTGGAERPLPVSERLEASLATAVWCLVQGASMVRVHDVVETVRAATIVGGSSPVMATVGGR